MPRVVAADKLPGVTTLAEIESTVDRLSPAEQEELLARLSLKLHVQNGDEFPVREDHVRLLEERFAEYSFGRAQDRP